MIDLKQFPKARIKLEKFFRRNLEAFQKNIMKEAPTDILEIPKIEEEWVKKYTESSLATQPRILYDFLDENEIYITIDMFQGKFFGKIIGSLYKTKEYDERVECELETFQEAFRQLEDILNK